MVDIGSIKRFFLYSSNFLLQAFIVLAFCFLLLLGFTDQSIAAATSISTENIEDIAEMSPSADVPTEKIDQFSQAYLQVLKLFSDREAEIPAAETNAEALKIEKSIEADAITIIENSGLTLSEYMQILGFASQDVTFQEKVLGRMDETQDEP